ncbi:MAG TPA: nitrogen fixation protein NifH [Chloroflexia bacterium]|nr:nitrogen fixation protein NifH [Chloroflexia bacterium]
MDQHPNSAAALNADPLPWLLEEDTPAVRHVALGLLLGRPEDDPEVRAALAAAMRTGPIADILAAQHPDGYWVKPGPGYAPKYTGTVWQLIFLDQLGADPHDERVQAACEYVLSRTATEAGGLGCSGSHIDSRPPPPSSVIHCLNGNLLRALVGFGRLADERVQRAIDWQARSITGEGFDRYYRSGTSGPGFACAANEHLPCAWGAIKALLGLARIPAERREPHVVRAIEQGVAFLLSRDPAAGDYPMGWGNTRPNGSWFKPGFPSGYVADVLQNLQVLCELGYAHDERLRPAVEWLLSRQDGQGRWKNEYAYNGKTWGDFEKQGKPSKWVTLRARSVVQAVLAGT